jgi:hypothetical protein
MKKICDLIFQLARNYIKSFTLLVIINISNFAYADVANNEIKEVEHLLNFIKTSSCIIYRNGSRHTGIEAVTHIEKKYDYFRDRIKTTEDFIEYSATKSTMSGKYYTVKCGSENEIRTRDWLLDELKKYREKTNR